MGMYLHLSKCPLIDKRKILVNDALANWETLDDDELDHEREEWGGEPEERDTLFIEAGGAGLDNYLEDDEERPRKSSAPNLGEERTLQAARTPRRPVPAAGVNISPDTRTMPGAFGGH